MGKLKNIFSGAFFAILILLCTGAQVQESHLYVKVEKENLRDTPKGNKIGEILQSTKMRILEENDEWVKVEVTAWIWKASTTAEKSEIESLKAKKEKAVTRIAGGFAYKNIRFKSSFGGFVEVIGEMTNNSGNNISAMFTLSVYDKDDNLLAISPFVISNFQNGQTKSFQTMIEANYGSISKHKIDFESGY